MLTKPFENVFVPGEPGRAAQVAHQVCSPYYANPSGTRCTIVYVYGPPGPDGGPTIIRYYTVCV